MTTAEGFEMLSTASGSLVLPIFVVRIVSPAIVFLATLSLIFAKPPSVQSHEPSSSPITSVVVASRVPRRAWILSLLTLSALTYLLDGIVYVVYAVLRRSTPSQFDIALEVNAIVGLVSFAGLAALGTWKDIHGVQVWFLNRVKHAILFSMALDIALSVLVGLTLKTSTPTRSPPFFLSIPLLLQLVFPAFRVLLDVPLLASLHYPRVVYGPVTSAEDDEEAPTSSSLLLPPGEVDASTGLSVPGQSSGTDSKYGTFRPTHSTLQQSNPNTRPTTPTPPQITATKTEISLEPSWSEIWQRLRRLRPYLWPSKSKPLQLLALICMVILLIGRGLNVILPFALGELTKIFEGRSDRSPLVVLVVYVVLRFLQGSGGLNALRDSLWTPVMQYSDREMSQLSFNHLLDLSFSFHTKRKTGEVLRVLDRGAAINHALELVLFNVLPTFLDILIALVVFCARFEWTLAVVIFLVIAAYVSASVILTQWRTRIRREMNERDIITRGIHTDCLLNYETVKYFCGEEHEAERYTDALRQYQALEYKVIVSLNLLNLVQNFIISLGLLVGSIIVAHRVIRENLGASEFIIFITYLGQLYAPLNQLGYLYRSMNQSLVDTEKLLKLLNEPTDINDKEDASELVVEDGEIEFENVNFSYDTRTTALNGISFKIPKNSSVALVGESGSGKSTILRLLYRFYDLEEGQGRILIDGKDIRDVTQKSLRQAIGVVPQDSVLFNTSIKYNIGYGKFDADEEEIEAAARSAQMHDRIMSFPDGYNTTVGERGVRLSGGEKQRVAIARTLLKNPPILLLDEATSALDTSTEKDIQKALQNLMEGRSSLSIAHRLSTIASADLILVLKDGRVVEQGTHKELLEMNGNFAAMWADQVSADDPASSIAKRSSHRSMNTVSQKNDSADPIAESSTRPTSMAADAPYNVEPSLAPSIHSAAPSAPAAPAEAPVAFPTSAPSDGDLGSSTPAATSSAPLAFPSSGEQESIRDQPTSTPGAGVTFDENAAKSGSPEPLDPEHQRKRRGSQNFQRIARRISLGPKRQESSSGSVGLAGLIPGLRREKEPAGSGTNSPRMSEDNLTSAPTSDSPTPSDTDPKVKKDKKEKKGRKSFKLTGRD